MASRYVPGPAEQAQLDLVRRPVLEASTLPAFCYTSPAWFEAEVEGLFLKEWLFVGRAEEVPRPGDYLRVDVVGQPLLLVRGADDRPRAFLATCRHRQAELVTGRGSCKAFRCPYHSWTYGLDGRLLAAPGMEATAGFEASANGLVPVRLETWGGFLFVCFDPAGAPLGSVLGDLPERVAGHRLEDMRVTRKREFDVRANWKLFVENSREAYHVNTLHRSVYETFYPGMRRPEWRETPVAEARRNVYELVSGNLVDGMWEPARRHFPAVEALGDEDMRSTHFALVYPSFMLAVSPSHIGIHQLFPLAADRTLAYTWSCFPKTTVERPDFEDRVGEYYALPDAVIPQDVAVCEGVQRALSRFVPQGRFSTEEVIVHRFANYVLDKVLGTK